AQGPGWFLRAAPRIPAAYIPGAEAGDIGDIRRRRPATRQVGVKLRHEDYELLVDAAAMYDVAPSTLARMLVRRGVLAIVERESSFQAAIRVSRRACSTSMRDFATKSWTNCLSASLPPKVSREFARLHIISMARSAVPIARMQWWMRPGPSRSWAITKPAWRGPSRLASGTRQSS